MVDVRGRSSELREGEVTSIHLTPLWVLLGVFGALGGAFSRIVCAGASRSETYRMVLSS